MHKRKPTKRKPTYDLAFMADQIDAVATLMWALAERMERYAGCSIELHEHSHEMAGASVIARGWANAIRKGAK